MNIFIPDFIAVPELLEELVLLERHQAVLLRLHAGNREIHLVTPGNRLVTPGNYLNDNIDPAPPVPECSDGDGGVVVAFALSVGVA